MSKSTPPAPVKPAAEKEGTGLTEEELAAIKVYNEHVERDGVFSDGLRSF